MNKNATTLKSQIEENQKELKRLIAKSKRILKHPQEATDLSEKQALKHQVQQLADRIQALTSETDELISLYKMVIRNNE